jgi:hypothetical protein
VAIVEGREVQLLEFPLFDRVQKLRMSKGLELDAATSVFFGPAALAVPGKGSIRIATRQKVKTLKLPGQVMSAWGDPSQEILLVWCAVLPADGSEPGDAMLDWQLVRVTADGARWRQESVAGLQAPAPPAAVVVWSADGKHCLVRHPSLTRVLSTRKGELLLEAHHPGLAAQTCEGLTAGGKHAIAVGTHGERIVWSLTGGEIQEQGAFVLDLPEDAAPARYFPAADRWVSVSADRRELYVLGPPGADR